MLFAPDRSDRILTRRVGGLAASAALHATVVLAAVGPLPTAGVLQASAAAGAAGTAPLPRVVVVESAPPAAAATVTRRPALELSGIEVDLDKLSASPAEIFPFVLLGPLTLGAAADADRRRQPLRNPLTGSAGRPHPPLRLSDSALQAIVDRAWSRRERWAPFRPIADLIDAHDGDAGRAADLLRAYTDQNLLQPYYDGDTIDARYWTMLGLAADHGAFVEKVTAYLHERPGTKVATELVFLLDELVQGSLDTLLTVVSSDPASALRRSASEQPAAYARAQALHAETRDWLRGLGLDTPDAMRRRLEAVRLGLLASIVERSPAGYRVADAHYLAGVIYFERRERDAAYAAWMAAVTGPDDLYSKALLDIRAAFPLAPDRRVSAVVAALGAEHGRWLTFSERRLHRFGYRAETF